MYEPKYLPQLNNSANSLGKMRFAILYENKYFSVDDPNSDPLHLHEYLEIFVNLSSDVTFLVKNNVYRVGQRDAVLTRPSDTHVCIFNRNEIHEHCCIWIDADFALPEFDFLKKTDFCPLFSFDEQTKTKLKGLVLSLLSACENGGSELEKSAYILQILTLFEKNGKESEGLVSVPKQLQNILDDIHAHFFEVSNVTDLIKNNFVSSATLNRWFRKYIHTSPREYLESVRLSNAVTMLQNGASVTDACMSSGFSDCSHFIVLFKKKFGVTPFQYKKNQKEKASR